MISIKTKLFALALGSFIPAVLGAITSEQEAERLLLAEASASLEQVQAELDLTLGDYQKNSHIALSFAADSTWFTRAIAEQDKERTSRFVERLSKVYPYRAIVASNADGLPLASIKPAKGGAVVEPKAGSDTAKLLQSDLVFGLVTVDAMDEKNGEEVSYALVAGTPVAHEDKRVGSLALFSFVNTRYVEYLKRNLGADLTLRVNDKVIASTENHPATHLQAKAVGVVLKETGNKLFAISTFAPQALNRPGLSVQVTASHDVTELRDTARSDLYKQLLLLTLATFAILAFALRFASRLSNNITHIAQAARATKEGHYTVVPDPKTNDEVQTLAHDFNDMIKGLEERDHLKETFGRYVTRQVADHLMKGNQNLGGELVPVTVLFSDIRSFTSISENMDPRELLDFLNEYFSGMVESVMQHQGVVDKFIGDAIMAVFGAPLPEPEDPLRAVQAALSMQARLMKINEGFKERGLPEIKTGIGLHSGQVIAGNMGHSERMEYTVIGDTVNLASRLEGMTKELACDVVMSEDLYNQVKDDVVAEPLRKIKVKGRDQEVMVYRLIGLAQP